VASAHDGRRRALNAQPVIAVQLESSSVQITDRHPRYIRETAIPPFMADYGWMLTPACCLAAQSWTATGCAAGKKRYSASRHTAACAMAPCAFLLDAAHSGRCSLHSAQQRSGRCGRLVVHAGGSSFGTLFRVTTFGESHGKGVGCVLDGVPPRLPISKEEIQAELDRRRPGQSRITTPRKESDTCEIYSGALAAAAAIPTPRP
jgi:hypothetical protein